MANVFHGLRLVLLAAVVLFAAAQQPRAAEPKVGDVFPAIDLIAPQDAADLAYLGLPAAVNNFRLGDIKADVVIVQVFSMYCNYCQEEAPQVRDLFRLIREKGLEGAVKLIGIGARNTRLESGLFRKKFAIPFPLLPDPQGAAHTALGKVMTPYFFAVSNSGKDKGRVIFTHLGAMPSAAEFLRSITTQAGLQ